MLSCVSVVQVRRKLRKARTNNPAFSLFQENHLEGNGLLGPTVRAIVTDQFHRSLFGKGGFWWEDDLHAVRGFIKEIRRTTMGKIFKHALKGDNWDGNVFIVNGYKG